MKYLLAVILLVLLVIRMLGLSTLPNGFYWDEMDNAYQAYSLLHTGKDMFGNPMPVLLHAFADYKSSLYIYATVPVVKVWGMSALTARIPAAAFGLLAILAMVYLVGKKWGLAWGIVSGSIFAISPWWFTYSRLSFEAVGMLALFLIALACLHQALSTKPRYLVLAGLFFSLAIWCYSTAKLFVPVFGLLIIVFYARRLLRLDKKILIISLILVAVISAPVFLQSFFGKGNTRFNEVSIFTDPTINSEVNYALELGQVSSGVPKEVGLHPRSIDRLANNKYQFLLNKLVTNYLNSFSSQFLFTKGDPNLRQSPGTHAVGQLLPIDFVLLGLGLYWYAKEKNGKLLLVWLVLSPLPSIITREGGEHATRLLFMLPPLIILITAGMRVLVSKKVIFLAFLPLYLYFVFSFGYYYFSYYRFESLIPFHWGFQNVAQLALDNSAQFQQVIIDLHHESDLMAFLVQSRYDPKLLQSQMPLVQSEIVPGVLANKFGNIYILGPGDRSWSDYRTQGTIPAKTLLILAADKNYDLPVFETIYYPNGEKAFYLVKI